MSTVNLLPPEVRQAQRWRRLSTLILIAGAALFVLVLGYYLLQAKQLSDVRGDIEAQAATNAGIQTEIASKQQFADLQAEAQAKEEVVATAYAGEVSFSSTLMDISRVMPSDAYLEDLTAGITGGTTGPEDPSAVEPGTVPSELIGSIAMNGQAISVETVSALLTRLEQVEGWVNPWASSLVRNEETGGYTFSITVDLDRNVITDRGREAGVAEG